MYLEFSEMIVDREGLNMRSLSVSIKADGAEIQSKPKKQGNLYPYQKINIGQVNKNKQ